MNRAPSVEAIFFAALELGNAAEQAAYLDSACAGDAALRRQVEKMLRACLKMGDFLDKPAGEQLAAELEPSGATQEITNVSTGRPGSPPERSGGEGSGNEAAVELLFLSPSTDPDSLGRIGHYEVLQVLGKGGFGIVFRAFDALLQRVVALKVLAPELAATSKARQRFLREARASAKVRHENIVQVFAVEEQPVPYLVMEFIPGETLRQKLDRVGSLAAAEVLRIGRQIAEGLAAAHAAGLIHRDIKPDNILLEAGSPERVKISDFGLARAADDADLSQSGVLSGTPMYMAPEQAEGETLDHRADLFSLGSVLYVMAAGRPPFRASTIAGVLKRVVEKEPPPIRDVVPEIPQRLCEIIARLHAKKPEDRFATATEVADLLGRIPGEPAASAKRPPRFRRRRWEAAAAVLLTLLGGLGFTEATGVTDLRGTVIRLFSPEGTLVVEVDDPGVSVRIDGPEIIITGAGTKEIRLKPGRYTVEASKDGKRVRRELVTVTNNGKQVVRISQETSPTAAQAAKTADAAAWERAVVGLSANEQIMLVAARLRKLNPGFDGALTPTIEQGVVTGVEINIDRVNNLAPIRALTGLASLTCRASAGVRSRLMDLSPLKGLPLTRLHCVNCNVYDLTPLAGMKLKYLHVGNTLVHDLSPLKGMPLKLLNCDGTLVSDLSPLKGMPLSYLNLDRTKVSDLAPLRAMRLIGLVVPNTNVSDLSPLKGMPLESLQCQGTKVADLSPLKDLPLTWLYCDFRPERDAKILQAMPSLKTINGKPAAEFWKIGKSEH